MEKFKLFLIICLISINLQFVYSIDENQFKLSIEPHEAYNENYVKISDFEFVVGSNKPFLLNLRIENLNEEEKLLKYLSVDMSSNIKEIGPNYQFTLNDIVLGKKGTKTSVERYPIPVDAFGYYPFENALYSDKDFFKALDKGELKFTVKTSWSFDTRSYSSDTQQVIGSYEIKIVPHEQLLSLKNEEKNRKLKENLATLVEIITFISLVGTLYFKKKHNVSIVKLLIVIIFISLFLRLAVF